MSTGAARQRSRSSGGECHPERTDQKPRGKPDLLHDEGRGPARPGTRDADTPGQVRRPRGA